MKKAITITAALMLITAPALADIESIISYYNTNTVLTSATKLSGEPEIREHDGKTDYDFRITDNVIVSISAKDDRIRVCSVICRDEAETAEFLAQCAASASTVVGFDNTYYTYADILDMFLQIRAGETPGQRSIASVSTVYQMTKESFGYLFMIAR